MGTEKMTFNAYNELYYTRKPSIDKDIIFFNPKGYKIEKDGKNTKITITIDEFDNTIDSLRYCTDEYMRMVRGSWNKELQITNVIFNYPATIVLWNDGTKTVVKCDDDDTYDKEKGLAMAICKKVLGNKGNYYNEFNKWLSKDNENKDANDIINTFAKLCYLFGGSINNDR